MSLLMQALKKAEQSKQKQNDFPVIEEQAQAAKNVQPTETKKVALSLDIDDSHMLATNNVAKESEQTVQNSPATEKSSSIELSLTPQQDERMESKAVEAQKAQSESEEITSAIPSDNAGNIDAHFNKIEPSLTEPNHKDEDSFLAPTQASVQTINEQNASKSIDSEALVSTEIANNQDAKKTVETSESESESEKEKEKEKKQIVSPKIDAEQKQMIEQANKNRLLDQQKARAVFSSKAPDNTLRFKWLSIVAIAVVVALVGFAYMLWQKSNASSNQFPAVSPLATQIAVDITPLPQESVASSDGEVLPIDQTTKVLVKTDQASTQAKLEGNKLSLETKQNTTMNSGIGAGTNTSASINKDQQDKTSKTATQNTRNFSSNSSSSQNIQPAKLKENSSVTANKKMSSKATSEANAIEIVKGTAGAKLNPNLVNAYQAYMAGDRAFAEMEYQKVLQQEPNNRDALLGLAAIALNQRQAEQAGEYYGRLLVLDPNDADAIAGLTSLQQADPVQSESRLKAALNQTPSSGPILFALGNLYAQQSRWSDAQQTYFRAYANAPTNADYAFNLAISLDRLNQRKLAIEYYQRAINLAKTSSGNFNANKVQQRLTQLESIRDN